MFRIAPQGGAAPQLNSPDVSPPDPTTPGPTQDQGAPPLPARQPKYTANKVPQENAGYQGPDQGPFKCGNCEFFDPEASTCHIVSGQIDAEGCCNNFVKLGAAPAETGSPDEESSEDEADEPDESEESV